MKTQDLIKSRHWVLHVDDERGIGNGVIIMLIDDCFFVSDPDCGTKGFDTLKEAEEGTRKKNVIFKGSGNGSA